MNTTDYVRTVLKFILYPIIILLISLNIYFGIGPNIGLSFGYYGKFNSIMNNLEDSGIEVIDWGLHRDITLEDFQITVLHRGEKTQLEFENANIRSIDDLKKEIASMVSIGGSNEAKH